MLIKKFDDLKVTCRPSPVPNKVLMVRPDYFDVKYAINPYMTDSAGQLQKIDRPFAIRQWQALHDKYVSLGVEVNVLEATEGFPDMVFCANQSLPFWNETNQRPAVIMSQMRSEYRQGEVKILEAWYRKNNYEVINLSDKSKSLEGNGDAILHPNKPFIWGGCGPRTDLEVYDEVSAKTKRDVIILPLLNPDFYHLDTCFSILSENTVVIQPEAFSLEARKMIKAMFKNLIETSAEDCANYFTGNCHSPNGKDVILQKGCLRFEAQLSQLGFKVHSVDTSEFLKSGGSVFCLKIMHY